jgi:cytochrome c556
MTSTAFAAVRTALSAANFADAKEKLATTREGFTALETFWVAKKRDDAIEIVRTALAQIDEIDALLEVERPSRADTLATARMVQRACESCHALYREGEPETGFRFKAGVL